MNIKIRKEKKADFLDVHRLSQSAFGQDIESKLIDLLRKSEAFIPDRSNFGDFRIKIAYEDATFAVHT